MKFQKNSLPEHWTAEERHWKNLSQWMDSNLLGGIDCTEAAWIKFCLARICCIYWGRLEISFAVYNWKLPLEHAIYTDCKKSMRFAKMTHLLRTILDHQICEGIHNQPFVSYCICHFVPKTLDMKTTEPFQCRKFYSSKSCQIY